MLYGMPMDPSIPYPTSPEELAIWIIVLGTLSTVGIVRWIMRRFDDQARQMHEDNRAYQAQIVAMQERIAAAQERAAEVYDNRLVAIGRFMAQQTELNRTIHDRLLNELLERRSPRTPSS